MSVLAALGGTVVGCATGAMLIFCVSRLLRETRWLD